MKNFKKLGFTRLESTELVLSLNQLLANYHIHYQKLRNFHWNVVGPDFFELHEQFEIEYNQVKQNIDIIAERIRIFGHKPLSNLSDYLELSEIKESSNSLTSYQMVREITDDFELLLSYLLNALETAQTTADSGSEDMLTSIIKRLEKRHWMFTAWLQDDKTTTELSNEVPHDKAHLVN